MDNAKRVLIVVAGLVGISLAYQGVRENNATGSRSPRPDATQREPAAVPQTSGKWLRDVERKVEAGIVGVYVRLNNPTDKPVTLALWHRGDLEIEPSLVQRRRADGVKGQYQLALQRRTSGQTYWEPIAVKWSPETRQESDNPAAVPPVAVLAPGGTRTFLAVLGFQFELGGDSGHCWRLCLYDEAGGQIDQAKLAE
jgi:hypothetical protein